jgi:hypothetical protein
MAGEEIGAGFASVTIVVVEVVDKDAGVAVVRTGLTILLRPATTLVLPLLFVVTIEFGVVVEAALVVRIIGVTVDAATTAGEVVVEIGTRDGGAVATTGTDIAGSLLTGVIRIGAILELSSIAVS